jgi:hypothetical protein
MSAMRVDQSVLGHLPQPQMKRHHGILKKIGQASIGFDHHILHDVAGIDAAFDDPIHPQVDHLPDGITMAFEQLIHGVGIAALHGR